MKRPVVPFLVPKTLDPDIARVRAYWESLKRGDANMPFWDDFRASSLPDLADRLMLIDVADKPQRFRINLLGQRLSEQYGDALAGKFIDELELKSPFEYLPSQCSATVESRGPTFYQHGTGEVQKSQDHAFYSRLLLPMWGDGHVGMLLGAFAWL